jgi:hypothetical protein
MIRCLFERSTLLFVSGLRYDDIPHDPATHVQIVLDRETFPNRRTERWDGAAGIRPATPAEIATFDDQQETTQAQADVDQRVLRAVITYLVQRLNELRTQPATTFPALTAADVRAGIIAVYKALSD